MHRLRGRFRDFLNAFATRTNFSTIHRSGRLIIVDPSRPTSLPGWICWLLRLALHVIFLLLQLPLHLASFIYHLAKRKYARCSDVQAFIHWFRLRYGRLHPAFYNGTFKQALKAARKRRRLLLVYLHGDQHYDTDRFCRDVLCAREVVGFINSCMLCWACNTGCFQGYRASLMFRGSSYPFLAVILPVNYGMTVVGRLQGWQGSGELIAKLETIFIANRLSLMAYHG